MAPSPSPDPGSEHPQPPALDDECGAQLLDLAHEVIAAGIAGRRPQLPSIDHLPPALRAPAGVFVTLHVAGELQGCIGDIAEAEPLAQAVVAAARSAAFADPRFAPLSARQHAHLDVEVSVLSPRSPLPAADRAALRAALRPHIDGLVVAQGAHRALFLPDVWAQLPDPDAFVDQLLRKAGLAPHPWPHGLQAWHFTTRAWHRAVAAP